MALPTLKDFKALVPKATENMCEALVRAGQFDGLNYDFFAWMFNEDGTFTDIFKAQICAIQCVPNSNGGGSSTTTGTTTAPGETTTTVSPTTTTTTTTASCIGGVNYGNISPSISSGSTSLWGGGASLPPGYYRVGFQGGAIKYATGTGWCVNRVGTGYKIVPAGNPEIDGPFITYAGQSSQANVESANSGAYIDFYHAGGPIGMRLNDTGIYSDNTVQISAPTFSLLSLCEAAGDSNQNIIINAVGIATPYPSKRIVQGMATSITSIKVHITALHHSVPDEVQIMLQSPTGQTVVLMAGCGGANAIDPYAPINLVFDDGAGGSLPDNTVLSSGTFQPTKFGFAAFPSPAPGGPWGTDFSDFIGTNPNGVWKLWVNDASNLDGGRIGEWTLEITAS